MINLLPTEIKQANTYGLKNRILVRWCIAFAIGVLGIWLIIAFGFYQLNRSIKTENDQVASIEQRLKDQDIDGVRAQTEDIDSSIRLSLQVLEKKILFSKLIQRIGSVIPENAILLGIGITDTEGGIDLTAKAVDYQAATQVQVNISDPENNVFAQADIVSINCAKDDTSDESNKYPCTVNLRALFGNNSPFLFTYQEDKEQEANDD